MAITFPWTRGTEAQRAANSTVPAAGMLAVTSEGNVYAADGATPWNAAQRLAKGYEVTAAQIAAAAKFPANPLGTYVPPGWGNFWFPKLAAANAGTGMARVSIAGHSIMRGYYASRMGKGMAGLLEALVQTNADGGSGFQTVGDSGPVMQAAGLTSAQTNLYDTPGTGDFIATTGTWTRVNTAMGPSGVQLAPTVGGETLTAKVRGTKVRITYLLSPTGDTFAVQIDGVTKGTLSTVGAAAPGIIEYTVAAGTHQVVLTYTGSAGKSAMICGVAGENATGVIVDTYAVGGALSSVLNGATATWTGGPSNPADLVIIGNEANDLNSSVTPEVWARNLHLYLDGVKGNKGGGTGAVDILVVFCNPGLFDTSNYAAEYVLRARALCEHYGAAFVNFAALGRNAYDYWTTLGYWSQGASSIGPAAPPANGDKGHPSDAGHLYMANTLAPIITGNPAATAPSSGLPAGGNTNGTATAATAPGQVTGLTVTPYSASSTALDVAWAPAASNGAAISDYTVHYRTTGSGTWLTWTHTATATTTARITGLAATTSYEVQVAGVNTAGTGTYSATVTASTAPATSITADSFNRVDNTSTLGSTDAGTIIAWVPQSGSVWGIESNRAKPFTLASASVDTFATLDIGQTNHTTQVTITALGSAGLVGRCSDVNNYYLAWNYVSVSSVRKWGILKKVAGGAYVTIYTSGLSSAAGDVVKFQVNGTSLTLTVNGAVLTTITDTSLTTGTKVGIWAGDSISTQLARFDDLNVSA